MIVAIAVKWLAGFCLLAVPVFQEQICSDRYAGCHSEGLLIKLVLTKY